MNRIVIVLLLSVLASAQFDFIKRCSTKLPGRKYSCPPELVLQHAISTGWEDSTVHVSSMQSYTQESCLYKGNCNTHGENLLGRCFCIPGWTGSTCELRDHNTPRCSNTDDRCFYTEDGGVWLVSTSRWRLALEAESSTWDAAVGTGDRVAEHMADFQEYTAVAPDGSNLGTSIHRSSIYMYAYM